MTRESTDKIDVVYTWVDDRLLGYTELLANHAKRPIDLAPNRTRDNLNLLKYSLRSLERHGKDIRHVVIVTQRPQVPDWLDVSAPGLILMHHDQFMPAECLPTFNSFAIVSALHLIPGLSERFLYVEDDMLIAHDFSKATLEDPSGHIPLYPRLRHTTSATLRLRENLSPWNQALAHSNALLDHLFGPATRPAVNHMPLLMDKTILAEMCDQWPSEISQTRHSRFRSPGNLAPEYLYLYYALYTGRGLMRSKLQTLKTSAYQGLEDNRWINTFGLMLMSLRRVNFITLNDNFGRAPKARTLAPIQRFLERKYPVASRFELPIAPNTP